jgi:hypothetical protein
MGEAKPRTWTEALAFYDSLVAAGWEHIRAFREFVASISRLDEAAGLTPVTSHEMLIISPYTRYPDWFDGRHVRLHPLRDAMVRVEYHHEGSIEAGDTWTGALEEAPDRVAKLIADL